MEPVSTELMATSPVSTDGPCHIAKADSIGDTGDLPPIEFEELISPFQELENEDLEDMDDADETPEMYRQLSDSDVYGQETAGADLYGKATAGANLYGKATAGSKLHGKETVGTGADEVTTNGRTPRTTPDLTNTNASSSLLAHDEMYGRSDVTSVTPATQGLTTKTSTEL